MSAPASSDADAKRRVRNRRVLFFLTGAGGVASMAILWALTSDRGRGIDREAANAQFRTVATALGPTLTDADVRALVERCPDLRYSSDSSGSVAQVSTPRQFGQWHWVAWLEFGANGRLLAARYAVAEHIPARPEDLGLPSNACWGTAAQCAASTVMSWKGY